MNIVICTKWAFPRRFSAGYVADRRIYFWFFLQQKFLLIFYVQLKETWDQNFTLLLWHIFVNFMEKGSCTKLWAVLISFQEVMKWKSFEFDVSDVINVNVKIFHHWFPSHIFVNFMEKVLWCSWQFFTNLVTFHVGEFIHTNEHTSYANFGFQTFRIFVDVILHYDEKVSF